MANNKKPSIYSDRSSIGNAEELDEYGVWVKSEPQVLSTDKEIPEESLVIDMPDDGASDTSLDFSDIDFSKDETSVNTNDDSLAAENDLEDFNIFDDDSSSLDIPDTDFDIPPASDAEEKTNIADFSDDSFDIPTVKSIENNIDNIQEGIDTAVKSKDGDLSTQLLLKIANELSSIRGELHDLKKEFSAVRSAAPEEDDETIALTGDELDNIISSTEETPAKEAVIDDDDETIALTGDELDNIVNSADFTEEAGTNESPENEFSLDDVSIDGDSSLSLDDMDLSSTGEPAVEDTSSDVAEPSDEPAAEETETHEADDHDLSFDDVSLGDDSSLSLDDMDLSSTGEPAVEDVSFDATEAASETETHEADDPDLSFDDVSLGDDSSLSLDDMDLSSTGEPAVEDVSFDATEAASETVTDETETHEADDPDLSFDDVSLDDDSSLSLDDMDLSSTGEPAVEDVSFDAAEAASETVTDETETHEADDPDLSFDDVSLDDDSSLSLDDMDLSSTESASEPASEDAALDITTTEAVDEPVADDIKIDDDDLIDFDSDISFGDDDAVSLSDDIAHQEEIPSEEAKTDDDLANINIDADDLNIDLDPNALDEHSLTDTEPTAAVEEDDFSGKEILNFNDDDLNIDTDINISDDIFEDDALKIDDDHVDEQDDGVKVDEAKDSPELDQLRDEGAMHFTPPPENSSYLEEGHDDLASDSFDLSDAVIDEPDLSTDAISDNLIEPSPNETDFDLDALDDLTIGNSQVAEAEPKTEEDDFTFTSEEEPFEQEIPGTIETKEEDKPVEDTDSFFDDLAFDGLDDSFGIADEPEPKAVPKEAPAPKAAAPAPQAAAPAPQPVPAAPQAAPAAQTAPQPPAAATPQVAPMAQAASPLQAGGPGNDFQIPSELKTELRSILSYMDQLLESLPEQKIEEFAKSEYFDSYKKLFKDLGLV